MNFLYSIARAEEAVTEAEPSWLETAFGDFADISVWGWVLLLALLIGGAAVWFSVKGQKKTVWTTKMLSLGAICMALSSVLSLIKLFSFPQGGSITPASMLPMILFAYLYGAGPGLTLGAIYGVLQYILDPYFVSVPQVLLDYPVAFGVIGLAGCFHQMKDERVGLAIGTVVGCMGRLLAAVASGVIFFAEYAPAGMNPIVYSLGYNATYMVPECIICAIIAVLAGPRLMRELKKVK